MSFTKGEQNNDHHKRRTGIAGYAAQGNAGEKNLMLITLTAGAHLDGITEFELPQCSRAEYKRHIKALRQMQHTDPTPYIRQVATKGIDLIREVCPIK